MIWGKGQFTIDSIYATKPIYTPDEIQQLKTLIDEEPRQIKQAKAALETATGKSSCVQTLKRVLKKT